MGRALIIICSAVIISLGIITLSTANIGKLLTQNTTTYANNISAKNSAYTGIQIAMQKISEDTLWAENHGPGNKWSISMNNDDDSITVYVEYLNSDYATNEYWKADSIRIASTGLIKTKSPLESRHESTVNSVYLMEKFSELVPPFTGALQLPSGYGTLNADGAAHDINGQAPHCPENKPPITVQSEATKTDLETKDLNLDGSISVDSTLSYEPTDELIARLKNSGNATIVNSDFGSTLGTADNPGVFFVDGDVKLSGNQKEGYGILVIQGGSSFEMEDPNLSVAGNFTFNGLVIFENAQLFDGHGTPTINGSVLVGDTEGATDINVDIGGNISINYDCNGENYAKMAAANAADQNKYTRVVTYE